MNLYFRLQTKFFKFEKRVGEESKESKQQIKDLKQQIENQKQQIENLKQQIKDLEQENHEIDYGCLRYTVECVIWLYVNVQSKLSKRDPFIYFWFRVNDQRLVHVLVKSKHHYWRIRYEINFSEILFFVFGCVSCVQGSRKQFQFLIICWTLIN